MGHQKRCVVPMRKGPMFLWLVLTFTIISFVTATSESSAGESEEEQPARHQLSLFVLGNTQSGSEHGLSIGLEYEYRWSRYFGTGAMVEYAGGDHEAWVAGIPFFIHPYAGWFLLVQPGVEIVEEENSLMVRTGVGYDFRIAPRWTLAPEFNVDLIEGGESKLVYGLTVSREF